MIKLLVVFAVVVAVSCDVYETQSTGGQENSSQSQYTFKYDVRDSLSGDSKNHVETRNGDVVQGEYSLIDADGLKRTVKYTADSVNGFNAVVERQPVNTEASASSVPKETVLIQQTGSVKNVAPVAYSASTLTINPPANNAVTSVPAHLGFLSGRVVYRSLPLSYATPYLIGSAPIAYSYAQFRPSLVPIPAVRAGW